LSGNTLLLDRAFRGGEAASSGSTYTQHRAAASEN
jgi:hypothetical protein